MKVIAEMSKEQISISLEEAVKCLKTVAARWECYDVMTALRGPDLPHLNTLKWIFTGRIRALIGIKAGGAEILRKDPVIDKRELDLALSEVKVVCEYSHIPYTTAKEALLHYLSHVQRALDGLDWLELISTGEYTFLYDLASRYVSCITDRHYRIDWKTILMCEKFIKM